MIVRRSRQRHHYRGFPCCGKLSTCRRSGTTDYKVAFAKLDKYVRNIRPDIRTGKRLATRDAHIVVNFRPTPHAIFRSAPGAANRLVIHLQPRDGLELHLLAQAQEQRRGTRRDTGPHLVPVQLDLDFDKRFGSERVGAYERLLLDVLAGRLNLFVRSDEQEEAWSWVEPLLDHWRQDADGPRPYSAGTWGPSASSAMIARDGFCWSEEA